MKVQFLATTLILSIGFSYALTSGAAEPGYLACNGISQKRLCNQLGPKIAQLIVMNVDSFGSKDGRAISKPYVDLVRQLQPGGVILHTGSNGVASKVVTSVRELNAASKTPLFVGVDYLPLNHPYAQGLGDLGLNGMKWIDPPQCGLKQTSAVSSLGAILGINLFFGPWIDIHKDYKRSLLKELSDHDRDAYNLEQVEAIKAAQVLPTLKHFPYVPDEWDLHDTNRDLALSGETLESKFAPFRALHDDVNIIMTTHVMNSSVDPNHIVTFSKKWVSLLKEDIGFKGLIITDGLFMLHGHPDGLTGLKAELKKHPDIKSLEAIFASKAILSGHDLVIGETTGKQTLNMVRDLIKLTLRNPALKARVEESYKRVKAFKASSLPISKPVLDLELIEQYRQAITEAGNCEE